MDEASPNPARPPMTGGPAPGAGGSPRGSAGAGHNPAPVAAAHASELVDAGAGGRAEGRAVAPGRRGTGWLRRSWEFLDDRLGFTDWILPIITHPVPRTVDWWYVFGSATLTAFIVQVITGVALAFAYVPAPANAYESIEFITNEQVLGSVVRGIHWWGASAMFVLLGAHVIQVFLYGSYKFPREVNWLTGSLLFLCTIGMGFTGQTLRWDSNAFWSIMVATEQAGRTPIIGDLLVQILLAGHQVGGATLTRFYATHVFLIPAVMFLLIGAHLYLVIRHGISEPPTPGKPVDPATYKQEYEELLRTEGVPFWPDAAWKDVVFALAVGAVVVGLSVILGPPPLEAPPNPTDLKVYPRPDWEFIWYFAVLALIPPEAEAVVILGFPAFVIFAFFALPFLFNKGERAPSRRPWAVASVLVIVVGIIALIREGYVAPWSPDLHPEPLPQSVTAGLSGSAARGAVLFQSHGCVNCHMIAGVGGTRGPNLSTIGSRLSRDELIWRIAVGGTNMPAYGSNLTPQQLSELLDFLQTRRAPQ